MYMSHIQPLNGVGGSLSSIDATNLQTLTGLGHSAFAMRLTWLLLLLFEIPSDFILAAIAFSKGSHNSVRSYT